MVELKYKINEN